MNDLPNITRIDAADNPLEEIKFLEETLDGKDWRASIAYPDASPANRQALRDMQQVFEQRGYIAAPRLDQHGQLVLEVHHAGDGASPLTIWKELGAARGTLELITHPGIPLGAVSSQIQQSAHWLHQSIADPAKANGIFNMAAELVLMTAGGAGDIAKNGGGRRGFGQKISEWAQAQRHGKNLLQTLAGVLFFAQSVTYALFAKTNDEVALEHLDHKLDRIKHTDGNLVGMAYDPRVDADRKDAFDSLRRFIRKYPVQIGAMFNNIGMLLYAGHALGERTWNAQILAGNHSTIASTAEAITDARKYNVGQWTADMRSWHPKNISGFAKDVTSSLVSLTAWSLLLLPRRPRTPQLREQHKDNPFAQTWDRFRENPQTVSGGMTLLASTLRLMGSKAKGNAIQALGERIYLGGDIALMFTKNDDYGGEKTKNIDVLAEKIAMRINAMPHLFGAQAEHAFVTNVAEYLKQKGLEEIGGDPEQKLHLSLNEIEERTAHLARAVLKRVEGGNRLEKLAYRTAELVNLFPENQRRAVREKLVAGMQQLPWLEATPAELNAAIANAPIATLPPLDAGFAPVDTHVLSTQIRSILDAVPGIDIGASATAIYHAVAPFIRASGHLHANTHTPTTTVNQVTAVPSTMEQAWEIQR